MCESFLCKPIFTYLSRLGCVCMCSSFLSSFFPFFFGVLGHEGVSRKTRTLEQAECGSSREVIIRVHESLAAWLLPHPTTYIHIYTAAAQKQCVRNITQHTYLGNCTEKKKSPTRLNLSLSPVSFVSCYITNSEKTCRGRRRFCPIEIAFCDFVILITILRNNYIMFSRHFCCINNIWYFWSLSRIVSQIILL